MARRPTGKSGNEMVKFSKIESNFRSSGEPKGLGLKQGPTFGRVLALWIGLVARYWPLVPSLSGPSRLPSGAWKLER